MSPTDTSRAGATAGERAGSAEPFPASVARRSPGDRRLVVFAGLALLLLSLVFTWDHDAWTPDEPRVVELARSVSTGSWAVPLLNGTPFLEQPPLYYDAVALAYRVFGTTVGVARSVSVVFGMLALAATYAFAARLGGIRTGALAALSLGLSVGFFHNVHRVVVDPALVFFVVASGHASLLGLTAKRGAERTSFLLSAYALASFAYLTKGAVGIGLAGFGFVAVVIALRDPRLLLRSHLWAAPLVFAAVTGPYHHRLYQELGWNGVSTLLVENGLGRAFGSAFFEQEHTSHEQPFHYYLHQGLPILLPTLLVSALGVAHYVRSREWLSREERFAYEVPLVWFALGFLALSAVTSKRELYLLPIFPAAATVAGLWLDAFISGTDESAAARAFPGIFAALVGGAAIALPAGARWLGLSVLVPAAMAVPIAALAVLGIRSFLRGERARSLGFLASGLVLGLVLAVSTFVPYVDEQKRLGPFLTEAAKAIPEDRDVCVLFPDETALGAVPFYTHRHVVGFKGQEAKTNLERKIAADREVYLIAIDKNPRFILEALGDLSPEVLKAEVRQGSRSLRLLRFRAAEKKERS